MAKNIYLRFPGGRAKALTLSYDDGVESDIRLIEIMKKHGLKGTFNINAGLFAKEGTVYPKGTVHRRMSQSQVLAAYKDSGMEIAVHGYKHPFWDKMPIAQTVCDIVKDREALENLFDTTIRGAAYPYGSFNDDVIDALDKCGIVYCRAVKPNAGFQLPQNFLAWEPTCHHKANSLELFKQFAERPARPEPNLFYLWGHSYEFDGEDNWHIIEEFAEYAGGRDDIWYATNIEIYDAFTAFKRLVISFDGTRIYNPSCTTVWFAADGKTYEIGAGESLCI
ncbi:MAG: polysaccharide deacetylase family protein [Clostridia bacterium]|nr:polysaccharide deacetylase family protein [Clostridia bacterium]